MASPASERDLEALSVPEVTRRRAGIVACSQARTTDEAREFLDMLGLLAPAQAAPVRAPKPAAPAPRKRAKQTPVANTRRAAVSAAPIHESTKPVPAHTQRRIGVPDAQKDKGTRPARRKLNRQDAEAIRRRWAGGDVAQHQLAAEYQVDRTTISDVVRYATWTDGSPVIGVCAGCSRPMITQPEYNRNARWRERGFARHGCGDRCNGCYSAWRKRGREQARPRFPASKVSIAPTYPVTCAECGPVGPPQETREAAHRVRKQHLQFHREAKPAVPGDATQPASTQPALPHCGGHALGLGQHLAAGEPLCPPCQELYDDLATSGHITPSRRSA